MVKQLLIRHAQSVYNQAVMKRYRVYNDTLKITSKDSILKDNHITYEVNTKIDKNNKMLIDSELTKEGIIKCESTGKFLSEKFPDIKYVFCSPFRRTTLSMHHIFTNYDKKIQKENFILFPLLGDPANLHGDYAFNTIELQKEFEDYYNFDFLNDYKDPNIWFLYNILQVGDTRLNKKLIKNWEKNKCKYILMNEIVKYSKYQEAPEDWLNVRARVLLAKKTIYK